MNKIDELVSGMVLELRRGTIVLSVLCQLKEPKYGYSLVQSLEEKEISIDAGTLYPLLRRLEKQELLKSEWETTGSKPRKYYIMSDLGREVYKRLCDEWEKMCSAMNKLIDSAGGKD